MPVIPTSAAVEKDRVKNGSVLMVKRGADVDVTMVLTGDPLLGELTVVWFFKSAVGTLHEEPVYMAVKNSTDRVLFSRDLRRLLIHTSNFTAKELPYWYTPLLPSHSPSLPCHLHTLFLASPVQTSHESLW